MAVYEGRLAYLQGRSEDAIRLWQATGTLGHHMQESADDVIWLLVGKAVEHIGSSPAWRWLPDKHTGTSDGPLYDGRFWYGPQHAFCVSQVGEAADAKMRDRLVANTVRTELTRQYIDSIMPFAQKHAFAIAFTHFGLVVAALVAMLLLLFGRQGPIGSWLDETFGIVLAFRWTGAALACAIMGFPLLVRAIQLSVEAVDPRLEQAASTLGANRAYVFLTVTLPLIAPGIIAGAILAFARSMGEFGATITFVSNIPGETQTLPSLIYTFTQVPGGDVSALRLTLVSVAISLGAILAAEALAQFIGRRVRAR